MLPASADCGSFAIRTTDALGEQIPTAIRTKIKAMHKNLKSPEDKRNHFSALDKEKEKK